MARVRSGAWVSSDSMDDGALPGDDVVLLGPENVKRLQEPPDGVVAMVTSTILPGLEGVAWAVLSAHRAKFPSYQVVGYMETDDAPGPALRLFMRPARRG